jgi:methyl-accepting chemotaxis protein
MDAVTQQNAMLVEEAAAAAEAMQQQAQSLEQAVSVFKIAESQTAPPARVPRSAPARQALRPAAPAKRLGSAKPAKLAAAVSADWEEF